MNNNHKKRQEGNETATSMHKLSLTKGNRRRHRIKTRKRKRRWREKEEEEMTKFVMMDGIKKNKNQKPAEESG